MTNQPILQQLDNHQEQIEGLLLSIATARETDLPATLAQVSQLVADLLILYAVAHDKAIAHDGDLLNLFKAFVKGDASLNAVRDNVREIVYYQNCLAENRQDALPNNPAKMAARTVQHIYFYLRSRLEQEHLLDQ